MSNIRETPLTRPSLAELDEMINVSKQKKEVKKSVKGTIAVLIVVAAVVTLVLTLWLPVVQVAKSSMMPTLSDGDVIFFSSIGNIKRGDVVAFYFGRELLIKRVIAVEGEWVNIDADGIVYIDDEPLDEEYVMELDRGELTVGLPLQVPSNSYFVMGDFRAISLDSRSKEIGVVHRDQIEGKALVRVWPANKVGAVK